MMTKYDKMQQLGQATEWLEKYIALRQPEVQPGFVKNADPRLDALYHAICAIGTVAAALVQEQKDPAPGGGRV